MGDTLPSSERPRLNRCQQINKVLAIYCPAMRQALSLQNPHGKGLSEMTVWEELDSPQPSTMLIGIVYREKANASGIMLNLCPWCGGSLKWWPDKEKTDG